VERWVVAFIIVGIVFVTILSVAYYYVYQPTEQYYLVIQHRWRTPPMTNTTAPFTISGKKWYVELGYASYSLINASLDISITDASTNALIEQATLTNEQRTHYFNVQGNFYLSMKLNNATNVDTYSWILVTVWEVK
jgi:hypothetical protein